MRRLRVIGAAGTSVADVEKALDAARQGKIRAIINRTMLLSAAAEAHRIVEQNQIAGKIILQPDWN
jgi:D-arabinose 1-dehydrogenase-like Zn-dependent alcohol dehydrogenase